MRNFDEERKQRSKTREERTFVLGGETFVLRGKIRPERLASFDRLGDLPEDAPIVESLKLIDDLFEAIIDPVEDAHVRYQRLRESDDPETALDVDDLRTVLDWAMEVVTGRPTGSPTDSSDGQEQTGTPSTDDSSSPVTPEALTV